MGLYTWQTSCSLDKIHVLSWVFVHSDLNFGASGGKLKMAYKQVDMHGGTRLWKNVVYRTKLSSTSLPNSVRSLKTNNTTWSTGLVCGINCSVFFSLLKYIFTRLAQGKRFLTNAYFNKCSLGWHSKSWLRESGFWIK